jgi:hypothetical protein
MTHFRHWGAAWVRENPTPISGDSPIVREKALERTSVADIEGATAVGTAESASSPQQQIVFIMGDDISWMRPSIYHKA